jgi:hypothetical protein
MTAARPTPSRRSRLLRSTLAAALSTGALLLAATPAHAEVIDTDNVLINGGRADFGNDPHLGGTPMSPGKLSWNDAGATRTGTLKGKEYWDDLFSGGCARVVVTLLDNAGKKVDSAVSTPVCRAGGGLKAKNITLTVSSPAAHRAVVTTQAAPGPSGPWTAGGTQTVRYGQPGGID